MRFCRFNILALSCAIFIFLIRTAIGVTPEITSQARLELCTQHHQRRRGSENEFCGGLDGIYSKNISSHATKRLNYLNNITTLLQQNRPTRQLVDNQSDGDTETKSHSGAIGHKIGACLVILGVGFFGCAAPFFLAGYGFLKSMTYVNAFACGAFLGLGFFHLLPEALEVTESSRVGIQINNNFYNLTFLFGFLGFIMIMVVERVLFVGLALTPEGALLDHHHHPDSSNDESENVTMHREITSTCALDKCTDEHVGREAIHVEVSSENTDHSCCADPATVTFSPAAFFACCGLAIHSLFEGFVVGMFADGMGVWIATISIAGHKWAAGFALAANCINKHVVRKAALVYLGIFVLASPIGVVVGIFVSQGESAVVGVINGLALGTILYIGSELLFDQFRGVGKVRTEMLKFLCLLLGASVVFGLMMVEKATDNDDD